MSKIEHVFVASPSDVESERKIIKKIVGQMNSAYSKLAKIELRTVLWENEGVPDLLRHAQDVIDDELISEQSYLCLIIVLWHRFGTPQKDAGSGWEHELEKFKKKYLEAPKNKFRVGLFVKNRAISPRDIDGNQLAQLNEFLSEANGLYKAFKTPAQFETAISDFLTVCVKNASTISRSEKSSRGSRSTKIL